MAEDGPRTSGTRRRRSRLLVVVLALVLAYGAADAADAVPGVLTTDPVPPDARPFPELALPGGPVVAPTVEGPDESAEVPTRAGLEELVSAFESDPRRTGSFGLVVADAITGEVILDHDGETPRSPASSLKVLTGAAALAALGADRTLTTSAVLADEDTVTLRGGGDTLLAPGEGDPSLTNGHAGLADLAEATAQALRQRDVTRVDLDLDDTLFTDPLYHPDWGPIDRTFVSAIQPIALDSGRSGGAYSDDPGVDAAVAFADALEERGVEVTGIDRGAAPQEADVLATVESAPISAVVRHMLRESDNSLAEVLGHLVAVERGEDADFTGSTAAVRAVLRDLGADVSAVTMADASGLSPATTVPPAVLVDVLRLSDDPANRNLHGLVPGLAVGGLDGTLSDRFTGDAAGYVRAKTGTLVRSVSLTGLVLTADGRPLHFSLIASDLSPGTGSLAHLAMEDLVTDMAACGCA
ncbi:D-alanyl-D-alanine carboxypeptidase/D-alanyl-D-alanine-endopeptidase [Georgenia alba]|uniref:D-alanyl-D-alanine carboxypeptidase/D-alanyl-D-alanine-endopeptidase n=1 Tax=Georgenia alba TaxID=2233858 RepID=A0ABW2QC94_9MICO